MEKLHNKILSEGRALNESVLKVDSFFKSWSNTKTICTIGTCFREYFNSKGITKIFTIESYPMHHSYDCIANDTPK